MKRATIADAPAVLNTNDKAMWVLGYNAALEAPFSSPPKRGVEVLRNAILLLRDEACYRDDEGEDTDALDDLLAWLTSGARTPVPHLSLCASQDDTMRGYPVCDCGADHENATRAAGMAGPDSCEGEGRKEGAVRPYNLPAEVRERLSGGHIARPDEPDVGVVQPQQGGDDGR